MRTNFQGQKPSIGVVVGTFAAVPYVHLHLESRRRFYPDVPLLVHDDASPDGDALRGLCDRCGVEFRSTDARRGHAAGDLSAFDAGLRWAEGLGLDLLVKFSRRFIPQAEWAPGLRALTRATQGATFSAPCVATGFAFRTEGLALHVPSWVASGAAGQIGEQARRLAGVFCLVEPMMHGLARRAGDDGPEGYVRWDFLGTDRRRPCPRFLWRHACTPADYHRAAAAWGLAGYAPADFEL